MKAIRLLPTELHNESTKPLTENQTKIIEILITEDGEIGFAELLEKANISASTIQTLEKEILFKLLSVKFFVIR